MDFSPADLFRSTKTGSRSSLDRVNKQLSASRGTFRQKVHIGVLVATVALVAYGAIIIWSASQFKADASFSRHLLGIGIGAVLAVLVWRTDLRGISNFSTALLVIDLIGRCDMKYGPDNPFLCVDRILKENEGRYDVALVEFHANATSEKLAMGYYLDGRVSAIWGTHTHVQTADERVNPKGTGYITDLGMTGPYHSVLGVRIEQSIAMFRGDLTEYFKTAPGDCAVSGAVFEIERGGKCVSVERVWKEYKVR